MNFSRIRSFHQKVCIVPPNAGIILPWMSDCSCDIIAEHKLTFYSKNTSFVGCGILWPRNRISVMIFINDRKCNPT
jgi:hypothetical protein